MITHQAAQILSAGESGGREGPAGLENQERLPR